MPPNSLSNASFVGSTAGFLFCVSFLYLIYINRMTPTVS